MYRSLIPIAIISLSISSAGHAQKRQTKSQGTRIAAALGLQAVTLRSKTTSPVRYWKGDACVESGSISNAGRKSSRLSVSISDDSKASQSAREQLDLVVSEGPLGLALSPFNSKPAGNHSVR